jgi:RNA polymerase sigma-70 factor (ECF subfamily)
MVLDVAAFYLMAEGSAPSPVHSHASAATGALQLEDGDGAPAAYGCRSLRRRGVSESLLKDALQDVFVVAHRRLSEFHATEHVRRWLFVIAVRVAANHRRALRRRWTRFFGDSEIDLDTIAAGRAEEPLELAEHSERVRLFYALLESLDDDKRTVFVLAELEQMSVPEIASILAINVNTAHARLRAGRKRFEQALRRFEAQVHARTRRSPRPTWIGARGS